jgi:MFS family permease
MSSGGSPDAKGKEKGMRNVTALGLVSFFTDFSTEMVLGILPLFLVSTLGASRAILGAIEGSAELTSYAFRMVSGSLSDKTGKRKAFVLAGYAVSTASKPFFAASASWMDAFLVRAGDRVGKGLRTAPRDALIADSVSESKAGRAFGMHRTLDQMGAIVGPVAAFGLLQVMDMRGVFVMSIVPGIVALLVLIFFVKEVAVKKRTGTILSNISQLVKTNRQFALLLVISGIFGLGAFNFSFVLLRASDLGVAKEMIPLVYAVINVFHTVIGIPAGILADRVGKEKVLILGYAIFAASSILMILLSGNSLYAYVFAAVFGLYAGVYETVQRAVVPRFVPSDLRGTAFGVFNLVLGGCFLVSNFAFGYIWDNLGLDYAVYYSLTPTAIAGLAMFLFQRKYSRLSQTET